MARRQLDKRLNSLRESNFARPQRGWIKAVREALGMTTRQLAARIGVGQSRAVDIEKAEMTGAITLDSLRRAALALDCELVYALIPRKSLETLVEHRAETVAKRRIKTARHTMELEDQGVDKVDEQEQIKRLTKQLVEKSNSKLWDDE